MCSKTSYTQGQGAININVLNKEEEHGYDKIQSKDVCAESGRRAQKGCGTGVDERKRPGSAAQRSRSQAETREGVKGFSSRSVALERTWDILTEAAKPKGERKQAGEAAVQKKRGRVPGPLKFVFPYKGAVKTVREDGLRGRALAMLKKGVLFADVESMVVEEDKKSGKPGTNTKRRAYRLIRAMHRHAGYGLRVDKENRIFAHQDA